MKKIGLKGIVNFFSVDFNSVDTNDILDIHKYLMKKTWYEIIFGLIKKIVIELLTGLVNGSNPKKCVSWSNQNAWWNLNLWIYILINTVKNFTTIHLQLIQVDKLEFVILLMTYPIKYVFQIKQKI